ncbi:hypothetical protein CRE_17474 [Caenorhabditis remanei]|uniref:Uncharacterized protein n=1 Tax=Caenorhabditis remanei TaxID=31234 RepID=E3N283_CAERE|nr:hypothetical protein CRE_17474 [Caenorhabditis remanei]
MENQEVLRSKLLSYEALKAVLKSLSLETREATNRRIPALRTINSRLPYILENVFITADTFRTSGRRWYTESTMEQSSENPLRFLVDPRKIVVIINVVNSWEGAKYSVNKSREEILEQLYDEYIRNGTVVTGLLYLRKIHEFLKRRRENEEDLKMKVKNLDWRLKQQRVMRILFASLIWMCWKNIWIFERYIHFGCMSENVSKASYETSRCHKSMLVGQFFVHFNGNSPRRTPESNIFKNFQEKNRKMNIFECISRTDEDNLY